MNEIWTEFVRENEENITELNTALLELENDPTDGEAIDRIFRTAHTLKGNCGAMGLESAEGLAHAMEDLLAEVRGGRCEITPEFMDDLFEAVDVLEEIIGEIEEHGEIETDPAPTIERLRARMDADPEPAGVVPPSDAEIDSVLEQLEPPADEDHETYFVRLSIDETDRPAEITNGTLVIEALIDAFDLLGTDPPRDRIDEGEYDGQFDAVFGSAVGEAAIASALQPVAAVEAFDIAVVTDRIERTADADGDSIPDVESKDLSSDEAQELGVDELLDEFEEFDDLDALVEDIDDDELEPFEEMGDAGSFDDLLENEDISDDGTAPETVAGDASTAGDEEVDDASAVFQELKQEVEMVDFDELQAELDELEFDEYEDEVGMEELIGDEVDVSDSTFLDTESEPGDPSIESEETVGEDATDAAFEDVIADDDLGEAVIADDDRADEAITDDELVDDVISDDGLVDDVTLDSTEASSETPAADTGSVEEDALVGEDDTEADETIDALGDDWLDVESDAGLPDGSDETPESSYDAVSFDADDVPVDETEQDGLESGANADEDDDDETIAEGADPVADRLDVTTESASESEADSVGVSGDSIDETEPEVHADETPDDEPDSVDDVDADSIEAVEAERDTVGVPESDSADVPETEDASVEELESDSTDVSEESEDSPAEIETESDSSDEFETGSDSPDGLEADSAETGVDADVDDGSAGATSGGASAETGDESASEDEAQSEDDEYSPFEFGPEIVEDELGEVDDEPSGADVADEGSAATTDETPSSDADDAVASGFESDSDDEFPIDADADEFATGADADDDGFTDEIASFDDETGSVATDDVEVSSFDADTVSFDDTTDNLFSNTEDAFDGVDDLGFEETDDSFEDEFGADVFESESDAAFDATDADGTYDAPGAERADAAFESDTAREDDVERVVDEPELEIPDLSLPERTDRSDVGATDETMGSVRVDVEQIDSLATLVEGLVTTRVRLRDAIDSDADPAEIDSELDGLEDLLSDLQETVMDVRLVPLERATTRLPRVVRDIAREQEKEVSFELSGGDVELDRSVLDRIRDPLIHLVRNAVDHGIEPPEKREVVEKQPEGTVAVRAERTRDRVTITVEDDGRGIDPDRLRESAVEAGVLEEAEADALEDEEAMELIFHPGLSTADEVTDVSGRGVGMDVVKRTVEELDGAVAIESERWRGTAVTMTLPVSVAIADILFVESGGAEYGVPLKTIQDIDSSRSIETIDGKEFLVSGEDETQPVLSLADAFETSATPENGDGMVVRVRDEIRPVAIRCDRVRDQQEVVVNPFEGFMADIPGVSGATVRGRGEVVPILDVTTL